ncbi:hypothetical protein ACNUCX_01145 [Curtobacterium flaccumfaciens pv. flaccumfaciens]|uniref:hypothetical protein n=1 Tax=Curtobacterium flaccumfaciens TaxID=2035 RepID=UPI003AB65B0B
MTTRMRARTAAEIRVDDLHRALAWWCSALSAKVARVDVDGPLIMVTLRCRRHLRPQVVLIAGPGALETCQSVSDPTDAVLIDPWGNAARVNALSGGLRKRKLPARSSRVI